jgi:cyclopropane fatty-acyl-phospholipid synthase-like methyltransferase
MLKPANEPGFDYKKLVREGYDRCAEEYNRSRQDDVSPELRLLISRLDKGASVLDIGCGDGIRACKELARTCSVTGVDISPIQIAFARQNVPSGHFLCGDIMTMVFPESSFDAVVSFYAIFHIPKEEHEELFRRIYQWLKPKGYLLTSVSIENEDPYTEDDFFGVRMYWSNYGLAEYKRMLSEIGFSVLEGTQLGHGYKEGVKSEQEVHPLMFSQKP